MSVVYKARDRLLNRIVAVKLLRSQSSLITKNVQRFRQEAVAALKMDHPNIIRVFEFDIPEHGEPYLVMEYLEGESIADLITENGPIELTRAISIMQAVCAGLEHAHKVGILHRDLKPSNIMLVKDQSGTRVKLFDFGIAKLLLGEGEPDHALTMTGEFLGSPLYMSPEQCANEPLDERSDIYGLGCVFYQMVTGQPPFRGNSLLETLQMHTSASAPPVKEIYAGIKNDRAIDAFLLNALAKNRDNRFQTVGDFNSALSSLQFQSAGDVLSRTKFQLDLLKHKVTEKRSWKWMLITASISIVILSVTLVIFSTNSSRQVSSAVSSPSSTSLKQTQDSNDEKPEAKWDKLDFKAQSAVNIGDYGKAKALYDESYELAKHTGPQYELSSLEGLSDLAALTGKDTTVYKSEIDRLVQESMDSAALIKDLKDVRDKKSAQTMIEDSIRLGVLLDRCGRFRESEKLLGTALKVQENLLPKEAMLRARCLMAMADVYRFTNENQKISPEERYRLDALSILKNHQNEELYSTCLYQLGRYYNVHQARPRDALPYLKKALDSETKSFGPASKQVAKCLYHLAICYSDLNMQALSSASAHEAITILRELSADQVDADSFLLLGDLEVGLRHKTAAFDPRKSAAFNYYQRSLNEFEKGPAKNYILLSNCCQSVAILMPLDSQERLNLLRRNIAIRDRLGILNSHAVNETYYLMAQGYIHTGALEKAKEILQKEVAIVSANPPGSEHRGALIQSAKLLAETEFKLGDLAEAEKNAMLFKSWAVIEYGTKSELDIEADKLLKYIRADQQRRTK